MTGGGVDSSVVVVGAGVAGASTVQALRRRGHTGPIVVLGAESTGPYERPPLAKGYLRGDEDASTLASPTSQLEGVAWHLGSSVIGTDLDASG